ncbi:HalOD1 output domain-containing protein [Halomicrobium salinisoli]|uniref:HalOD1 output domain-containing protein n=1 Tax=Halomicrobium salinisoli TaxID=2878391 RepID=UPI001CF0C193|nr:HalOD1 output domain-containing protein [Halomicrobium salinisoli]
MADSQPITQRTVQAVANQTGKHPLELPPLGRSIDVDTLNDLEDIAADTTVQFSYAGHTVTVRDDAEVDVRPTPQDGVNA